MKEIFVEAVRRLKEGDLEGLRAAGDVIGGFERMGDGVFDMSLVDENVFRAGCLVYPVYGAYETFCHGKEGYPDIVRQVGKIHEKLILDYTFDNVSWFLSMLIDTVDQISQEVYEYYRELRDLFKNTVKRAIEDFGQSGSFLEYDEESVAVFRSALERACDGQVLLREKYQVFFNK